MDAIAGDDFNTVLKGAKTASEPAIPPIVPEGEKVAEAMIEEMQKEEKKSKRGRPPGEPKRGKKAKIAPTGEEMLSTESTAFIQKQLETTGGYSKQVASKLAVQRKQVVLYFRYFKHKLDPYFPAGCPPVTNMTPTEVDDVVKVIDSVLQEGNEIEMIKSGFCW